MPEYARVCQSMPEYARVCQSMPEYARVCQSMPKYARVGKSMPEYARVCQSMPEYARVCQSQGCISCGILLSGTGARGVSSEHMENVEMFSEDCALVWLSENRDLVLGEPCSGPQNNL